MLTLIANNDMNASLSQRLLAYSSAAFPALSITVGKGYNYAAILILLFAIVSLFLGRKTKEHYPPEVKWIAGTFVFYFISFAITVTLTGNQLSDLDTPTRALLVIPVFLSLLKYPPSLQMLSIGFISGGYIAGLVGLYYQFNYPGYRAFDGALGSWWTKGYMQIQTGGMITTLGVSGLLLTGYYLLRKEWLLSSIALGSALISFYASILTGTRSGWLFIPIALTYILFVNRKRLNQKAVLLIVIGFILLVTSALQSSRFLNRLSSAQHDVIQYFDGEDKYTPVGIRLDLWKSALFTVSESPIIGVGIEQRKEIRKTHGDLGLIDMKTSRETYHAHNQFLENLSVYGILGLIALLGIIFYPLYIFEHVRKKTICVEHECLCQIGSVSIIMMIGYCLSQAFLHHNSGSIYYLVFTSILLASVLGYSSNQVNSDKERQC